MLYEKEVKRSKQLQLEAKKGCDRNRVKVLEDRIKVLDESNAKNKALFEVESKKSDTLEKLNEKLNIAVKKLTVKASLASEMKTQIVSLTKELEMRESMVVAIKSIVNSSR